MKDVFEPALSMNKTNVFEPMSNFNVVSDVAKGAGDVAKGVGEVASASARKKEAEAKILAIAGKEASELHGCDTDSSLQFFFDPKKQRGRISGCKDNVRRKNEQERQEQRRIIDEALKFEKEKLALEKQKVSSQEKISLQSLATQEKVSLQSTPDKPKETSNKKLIIGVSIGGGVLILATVLFLVLRKK